MFWNLQQFEILQPKKKRKKDAYNTFKLKLACHHLLGFFLLFYFILFYFLILWCSHIGDHPQEELAKFGYHLTWIII
jgi:hypothetical protein